MNKELTEITESLPYDATTKYLDASEIIPKMIELLGPLSSEEIDKMTSIVNNKFYHYHKKLGFPMYASVFSHKYWAVPYVKPLDVVGELRNIANLLESLCDNNDTPVFITFQTTVDDSEGIAYNDYVGEAVYELIFNVPEESSKRQEQVISEIKNAINSMRKDKADAENRYKENERKKQEAEDRRIALKKLTEDLQNKVIDLDQFNNQYKLLTK